MATIKRRRRKKNIRFNGWNLVKGLMVIRENGSFQDFVDAIDGRKSPIENPKS